MKPSARRQIVYDVITDHGDGSQSVIRKLSKKHALAAKKLIQNAKIRSRIVYDPDLDRRE
jgi:hypothetical protein